MSKGTLKEHKKIAEYLRQGKFEEASQASTGHINRVSRQIAEKSKQQSLLGKPK
jgi:DNA-binding FadR family transcriptional regulator